MTLCPPVQPTQPAQPEQPAASDAPVTQTPLPDAIFNGDSHATTRSVWRCQTSDLAPSARAYTLVVHRDGTGFYEDDETAAKMTWTNSGFEFSINMAFSQTPLILRFIEFTSTSFSSTARFTTATVTSTWDCLLNDGSIELVYVSRPSTLKKSACTDTCSF